ncbi:uncharacterized protein LOC117940625, partial [Etheostoma cragini]|uniref:uncharacterized protein LOC117940625 n=1 Tax=Etheostoma cragini TaxID=417921 RepID=UPI00155E5CFD
MKTIVVFFGILVLVSQHASGIEVLEGMEAVVLPCLLPWLTESTKVVWRCHFCNPSTVHVHQDEYQPYLQNQHFSGRTSMSADALVSGDLSLTLKDPHRSDSGVYTCTAYDDDDEMTTPEYEVHLQVSVPQHHSDVEVYGRGRSVSLPCHVPGLPKDTKVVWSRFGFNPPTVHQHLDSAEPRFQNNLYSGRTSMSADALVTGDLSLTLRDPHLSDSGVYTCTVYSSQRIRRQIVVRLQVSELFPFHPQFLLVAVRVLGLAVAVASGLASYFWQRIFTVSWVEVKEEEFFVKLPCVFRAPLPVDVTVEWSRCAPEPMKVHEYRNHSHYAATHDTFYLNRTKMEKDPVRTGDFSLTLRDPCYRDSGTYICTLHKNRHIWMQKVVHLQVKVAQEVVDVGETATCFTLPFKTRANLPADATVEWTRTTPEPMVVHVYENGQDQPDRQDECYYGHTKMIADPLQSKDLSVTINNSGYRDRGTYVCTVHKDGDILAQKVVERRLT